MKKVITVLMCYILLLTSCSNVFAAEYEYPKSFWGINVKYEEALKNSDYQGIIKYGMQIIDLLRDEPDNKDTKNTKVTRYNNVGVAYAELGDYDKSAKVFGELYNYVCKFGDDFHDYKVESKAKAAQYTSQIKMYTDKGNSTFYHAVNEKENGVLFGICSNGATRSKLPNESMVLIYQEIGQNLLTYNVETMKKASASGCAVEFALNCPREGRDIKKIEQMDSYFEQISDLFDKYPNVPVYLRFGAEFDIWTTLADPEDYKYAFRYVSEYFKDRHDNVAMVWSPNQVSNWYIDIDDYYPGDRYVDWVGMSLYAHRYFLGDKHQEEKNEIVFKTGVNSDPVIAVKDIVEKYGDRKPIMLSESGCGHKLVKSGEDVTDFALRRLQEYYTYLPMIYPQIKLIAYFDWHVEADTEKNDFRLSSSPTLQEEYLHLVKGPRFIQDSYNNTTDYCYRPIYDGIDLNDIFELSCYAHMYDAELKSVTYFIDGEYAGMSNQIPYTTYVNAEDYPGRHTLKAVAAFDNGRTLTTESTVLINRPEDDITVEISDDEINFDQDPVLYNNRTMVPMRKIFEELGATVSWDDETQTATGKKGGRTIKVSVGQRIMTVNDKTIYLDTAPIILSARTLVPVRAVAEGLGCTVDWDDRYNLVSITPKVYTWSDWSETLPKEVTKDMYYIEEKTEYRYRTREEEYFSMKNKLNVSNYVREEVSYGDWSSWQNSYISASDRLEVQTRTQSSPKEYLFAHYCTGNISDESDRYKTWDRSWRDECKYHELGWYNSLLDKHEDGTGYVLYRDDGKYYRCSNSCYRWYILDETGGDYTQYRSRTVDREYIYWEWGDWSRWSNWDDEDPYDEYSRNDRSIDVDERTLYRYKERD